MGNVKESLKNECLTYILSEPKENDIKKYSTKLYEADRLNSLVFAWHIIISDNEIHELEIKTFDELCKLFKVEEKQIKEIKDRAENNLSFYQSKTFVKHGKLYYSKQNILLKFIFLILFWIYYVLGNIYLFAEPEIKRLYSEYTNENNVTKEKISDKKENQNLIKKMEINNVKYNVDKSI